MIEIRFNEIDTLLDLARSYQTSPEVYITLCRSAHVLLVSHFEGIYKDIVKDIVDDLNHFTDFFNVKDPIFRTHAKYFTHVDEHGSNVESIKKKLWEAFNGYKTALVLEPFLRTNNKNPTPKILEEILKKFGEPNFFKGLSRSKLEEVFKNDRKASRKVLERLKRYAFSNVKCFPYAVDKGYFYNTVHEDQVKDKKSLFEEFINEFLNDRHKIVHGQVLNNPKNDVEIADSKIKIEVLTYAFIICLCHCGNPIIALEAGM
ncbi:HEPN domain-containing protein [Sphingobacterium paludis]|nr:HEPN domain-containing protein [Sphingobacterium paludis]